MRDLVQLETVHARTTVTGLRQRLDHQFQVPEDMSRKQFDKLPADARTAYDDLRLQYFGAGLWVPTREFRMLMRGVRASLRTTHALGTGERGIVITGPAHIGKSTMAMRLHMAVEGLVGERDPDFRRKGLVPSVHIDIQPKSTPKSIACHLLDFFETPYSTRDPQTILVRQAVDLLRNHGTRVLVFDEFQMLKLDGRTGDDAINTIRTIMSSAGAICVFSGIDLTKHLSSVVAQQLMRRCQFVSLTPLIGGTENARTEWDRILRVFSQEMHLLDQAPDHLMPYSDMLRDATQGSIGNLRRILSIAMESAIHDRRDVGIEEVTEDLLREVISFDASQVMGAG